MIKKTFFFCIFSLASSLHASSHNEDQRNIDNYFAVNPIMTTMSPHIDNPPHKKQLLATLAGARIAQFKENNPHATQLQIADFAQKVKNATETLNANLHQAPAHSQPDPFGHIVERFHASIRRGIQIPRTNESFQPQPQMRAYSREELLALNPQQQTESNPNSNLSESELQRRIRLALQTNGGKPLPRTLE